MDHMQGQVCLFCDFGRKVIPVFFVLPVDSSCGKFLLAALRRHVEVYPAATTVSKQVFGGELHLLALRFVHNIGMFSERLFLSSSTTET